MTTLQRLVMTLSQQGSALAPQKHDLEEELWGPCLGVQGIPKGSAEPGGRTLPPQTESYLVWWEGVLPPSHFPSFFFLSLIFLPWRIGFGGLSHQPTKGWCDPPKYLWASPEWVAPLR